MLAIEMIERFSRQRRRRVVVARIAGWTTALVSVAALIFPTPLSAQEPARDSIPTDVRVGILYQPAFRPGIVMPAMSAPEGLQELADSVRAIILRDLDYSDRMQVMPVGGGIPAEGPVNYDLWDELGAVWPCTRRRTG